MKQTPTLLVAIPLLTLCPTLLAADVSASCSLGELRTDSTPNCISIEWEVVGDSNHDATCAVEYREKGTSGWKQALPLFRIDYQWWYHTEKADRPFNMFAGSIMFLKPGTAYEVKLDVSDPDGGKVSRTISIATRHTPELFRNGRTLHVVPSTGGGSGTKADPFRGLSAAQEAAKPGDVVLIHKAKYGTFHIQKSGEPGRYIAWKSAGDGAVVFNHIRVEASHIWLEGLTLKREDESNALQAGAKASDVGIRRNDFQGFHYSILLKPDSRNWHITDNVIVGDNDPNQATGKGGISGEGVELNHSGGHVVAYNSISRVADGVSYPERNVDIFGNDIFDVSDDGLEPDRGYANVRMWGNRITNAKNNAISFQPMRCGPWYIVRNLVVGKGSIFKFRVQDRFVLANNTFVRWGSIGNRMHHILTSFSRNNLYISADGSSTVWTAYDCNQPQYCLPNNYKPTWMAALSNLIFLDLRETLVSDVTPLAGLGNLKELRLDGTPVRDLTPLAGLSNLDTLWLVGTNVTNVTPLAGLKSLEELDLGNTPVTDVSPLTGLKNLRALGVKGTPVTPEQIDSLRQVLPNIKLLVRLQ